MSTFKKAYEMTLEEYRELVVPNIVSYFKFLKKNSKFFVKADYYGLRYLSWNEYSQKAEESYDPKHHSNLPYDSFMKKLTEDRWRQATQNETVQADEKLIEEKEVLFDNVAKFLTVEDVKKFEEDEKKSNKRIVKRSADSGLYVQDLMDGKMTPERVQQIFDSVGVRVPKHVQEMKDKVQYQGYSRSTHDRLVRSSKDFEVKLRKELEPYMHHLELRYKISIEKLVNDFLTVAPNFKDSRFAIGEYCNRKATSRSDYESKRTTLQRYVEGIQKVSLYDERLQEAAKQYAESFIGEFLFKVQDKLKVITAKKGIPTFEISELKFGSGRAVGNFYIHYPDATTLRMETEIIFAGGYNIQRLHDRYLFKVFKDGKLVKLEDIDKAFESVNESIKLKRYKNLDDNDSQNL
jgi:hypothetical protein